MLQHKYTQIATKPVSSIIIIFFYKLQNNGNYGVISQYS